MRAGPDLNGYRFQIGEVGTAWLLGPDHLPGTFAAGVWDQTGTLTLAAPPRTITQDGTHGVYAFASQRLWRGTQRRRKGMSGFVQFGAERFTDDDRDPLCRDRRHRVRVDPRPAAGIPSVPGLAWSWLNRNRDLRPQEAMLQAYDQVHVIGAVYLQPALTLSPNPGEKTARSPAVAFTVQSTVLF